MKNRTMIFGVVLTALVCFALLPRAQAVSPAPDGCYPNYTTAEGCNALQFLGAGAGNTGIGWYSLFLAGDGSFNTGIGGGALALNTADSNTAVGAAALLLNTAGTLNVAVGTDALVFNDDGSDNNAFGAFALFNNVGGFFNNAHGRSALTANTASENNAFGDLAMENNTTGSSNTAIGDDTLRNNVDGSFNVAVGDEAGTGLGASVNNCIAIGAPGDGPFAVLDNTCFIGSIFGQPVSDPSTQSEVFVDQFNVVGIRSSSRRFKHEIQPMDKISETLYKLKPVTFKFNSDWKATTQYGLIAEEVAEVNPGLVVRGKDGEVQTVRYEQINTMLLNEFLKEHRTVQEQKAIVAQLKQDFQSRLAQQQKQIEALTAGLEKVSAQLEVSKPAAKVVVNKP